MARRKVRLTQQVLGTRPDGSYWPEPGTVITTDDDEAAQLVRPVSQNMWRRRRRIPDLR
jgi:hypothetical protein